MRFERGVGDWRKRRAWERAISRPKWEIPAALPLGNDLKSKVATEDHHKKREVGQE